MIINADDLSEGAAPQADLCVVGGGPAGILLALHAAESGAQVILLESGGRRPDSTSQALCEGEVVDPALHAPADMFRRRGLGGSTSVWGGRCMPLDPVDFAPRPWLDLPSTWPISHTDLIPFWRRAHAAAELGRYDYNAKSAVPGGMRPMLGGFACPTVSTERIERFSRPTDFGVGCATRLDRQRRVQVILHATVTNIALAPNLQTVAHLNVRTRGGRAFQVTARIYALAAGGLEVPRLLLASRSQLPAGIGNASDAVGRYYMCHLAGVSGLFMPAPRRTVWHGYERTEEGVYCRRRLSLEPWAQEAYRTSNVIARLHHRNLADPVHASGPLSALYLSRWLLPYEYRRRLDQTRDQSGVLPHVLNIVRDPWTTTRFAAQMLRYRVFATRKFPSIVVAPRSGGFTLDLHAEQLPNPESRIMLSHDHDRFGVPKLRIDWRYRPDDIRSVVTAMGLMGKAFAGGGHGTLTFVPAAVERDLRREGAYGGHHLGTARMSESPRTGVVDGDGKVHGINNLYITGGAVFATSGQANPTLTILALALRLADHLKPSLATVVQRPDRAMVMPA
jgi:choline dehydrogenase-like flavoprotein